MSDNSSPESLPANAIAVVGMAARLPGANTPSAFWDNLRRGEESIVTLSEAQLASAGVTAESLANPLYVRRAPLIDGLDEFDAEFFGMPPQTAKMMDPQHRLFLQTAWHAFEDAGYDPAKFDGSIGVYATSGSSMYLVHNLLSHHDPNEILAQGATFDLINMSLYNDKDYLATRVSHLFNLRGPSMTVQTACSSSLVAVHSACQSLLSGECDMVLAGGVSLRIPHRVGYWHEPGSMVSPLGRCRPFDAEADGTVFGSGVAAVVLKPLQAALEDGDRVHAVIRGSAINNDGSKKMTYAAPNGDAQADVIAEAHAVADVDSSTISYVETHGTGTPLGDPIEIEGLRRAFGVSDTDRQGPCAVGSVKSNIGHLAEVSGIAGLIKTILCLQNRAIPASLHYANPNPALNLEQGPFVIQSEYRDWKWDGPLRAGVSSFGVGGTNVHLVVEEAPGTASAQTHSGPQVLRFSAKSVDGLEDFRSTLGAELGRDEPRDLSDVAFTLAARRDEKFRLAAVVHDQQDAAAVLQAAESDNIFIAEAVEGAESATDRVVFLFPGQGAQHVEMARGLYESEPVFTQNFEACADGFLAELGFDLRNELFDAAGSDLERTDRAQPALFAVEYALGQLIRSYGVEPSALAGHSIGEYVAATMAGVFDLPTAIRVVATRARLMHGSAAGAMVAVPLSPDAVAEHLSPGLDIATVNDPGSSVVAGSPQDILKFQNQLKRQGIVARRVRTAHAFHSYLMDPVVPEFADFLSQVELNAPHTPLLSNVTGSWMTDDEARDPAMWARQIRATVKFADELDVMLANPSRVLVEVGPGGTLTGSAIRHPQWSARHRAVRLMRHQVQNRSDRDVFLLALGQLWSAGVEVDWSRLSSGQPRRVSLPGYPFARQKHWVEPRTTSGWVAEPAHNGAEHVSTGAAAASSTGKNGQAEIEATLQRICAECLGVPSVGLTDNFFDIGGDSLLAIGVAMSATNQGLELTPQDLYDHPNVSSLASSLVARYATGGLAILPTGADVSHPVPPSMVQFFENGIREPDRWRVPLLLAIGPTVGVGDVEAVLTAVTNHHDALRLRIVERAGAWEQRVGAPEESVEVSQQTLAPGIAPGSAQEREAVLEMIADDVRGGELSRPLRATYISDSRGEPRYLAITVLELVADGPSREILLTDLLTAFTQQLAGQDIVLTPAGTTWEEWSKRCTTLTSHPAVLESREYWLDTTAGPRLRVADDDADEPPSTDDLVRLPSSLTSEEADEIDRVRRMFQFTIEEVLLAALARTLAHTVGEGVAAIDLAGDGRSVLKPDVDPRRTVGGFSTIYPVGLECVSREHADAVQVLDGVHATLTAVPHHGIGHGLLRYLHAPTARSLGRNAPAEIYLSNQGMIPDLPSTGGPVEVDVDTAMSVRDKVPGLGHPIEVRVYRSSGGLHVDWWYDTRRVQRAKVEALTERFGVAIMEVVREAMVTRRAEDESSSASVELGLVDLSAE
ncbi:type I polyketide synthase [Mycolicibacterium stellerae]|uniref:type I polyketide synthase n=1 Tax=Mycolicibacterium stellerae TaxID=2358193 RepID=UPI000F0B3227|nr:type I polyketide synthase [Mycolicibacterium stellerae]